MKTNLFNTPALKIANLLALGLLAVWNIGFDKKTEAPWISIEEYKKASPVDRDKRVPVVAVINTVEVGGSVDIHRMPSVEIGNISPLEVTSAANSPLKVSFEDGERIPVSIDTSKPLRIAPEDGTSLPIRLESVDFQATPIHVQIID